MPQHKPCPWEKENPTGKEEVQKQVEATRPDEDKVKGKSIVEGSMAIEKKKAKQPEKKEKQDEKKENK